MDKLQIDQLLEKYWSGDSSIQEEQILKQYFTGRLVDRQHLVFKPLFAFYQLEKIKRLKKPIRLRQKKERPRWILSAVRVAAAVLLAFAAIWFWFKPDLTTVKQEVALNDSYDDPEIAYQEVERALYYLSGHMNKGVTTAASGIEKMKTLNEILKY